MKRLTALALACVLLMCCMAGCMGPGDDLGGARSEATPEITPTPVPTPDVPVTPEIIVSAPENTEEIVPEEVSVEIHGEENVLQMTTISGSFASDGGPAFTMMVEQERYLVNDVGGYCYITLQTGMSGDVYAELGFRSGSTAAEIGADILNDYGVMSVAQDLGDVQLGAYPARHIHGETVQNVFDAYLIDTAGGCMTAVLCTTVETEAHHARLLTSLESLKISE